MTADNIIKDIKLEPERFKKTKDGKRLCRLHDSNEYSRIYNRLDNLDYLDQSVVDSALTDARSTITFKGEGITVMLLGDFAANTYDLEIGEE